MKALEKVRERRYSSVADLAADIQRHLEHRPVLASPPSRLYRARKFLRRHRLAAFGTAAGLAFIALSGATVWSFVRRDSPPRPRLTNKRTIVLADFANTTGDSGFDRNASPDHGSAIGEVTQPGSAFRCAHERDAPPDGRGPRMRSSRPDVAAEICERTASAAVVEGSITSLGKRVRVGLARKELPNRRYSRRRAGAGCQKRGRLQGARPNGKPVRDPGRRIASEGGKGAQSDVPR